MYVRYLVKIKRHISYFDNALLEQYLLHQGVRSFSMARARVQPFFFSAPGGPKLARPLPAAVIGHAHLPRFSCFANGVGKRGGR